jgi:hypothetical protein
LAAKIAWCCEAFQSQGNAKDWILSLDSVGSAGRSCSTPSNEFSASYDLKLGPMLHSIGNLGKILNPAIAAKILVSKEEQHTSPIVAVLDSGLINRESIVHTLPGYDFVSDSLLAMDGNGRDPDPTQVMDAFEKPNPHGQLVASIIAANRPSNHVGFAPKIIINPIRILGRGLRGSAKDVADALIWASGGRMSGVPTQQRPADIIVMAFAGKGDCPKYLQGALDFASSTGARLLAAAGNHANLEANFFPANCRGVISVGSMSQDGVLEPYSNYYANIMAPGKDISCDGGDDGRPISLRDSKTCLTGTSYSVSFVAGQMALAIVGSKFRNQNIHKDLREEYVRDESEIVGTDYVEAASYDTSKITYSQMVGSLAGGNRQYSLICSRSAFVKSIQIWFDSTSLTAIKMVCKDAGNSITNTFQYGGTCFSTSTVESQTGYNGFIIGFQQWIRYVTLLKAGAATWEGSVGNRIQDTRDLSCPSNAYLIGFSIVTGFNCDARMDAIQTICAPVSCPTCSPGSYASPCSTASESTCLPCPAGTYQANAGVSI